MAPGVAKLPGMAVSVGQRVTLRRDRLEVAVLLDPFVVSIRRDGRELLGDLTLFTQPGAGRDRLIELTEGVLVEEELGERQPVEDVNVLGTTETSLELGASTPAGPATVALRLPARERVEIEMRPEPAPFRLAQHGFAAGRAGDRPRRPPLRECR